MEEIADIVIVEDNKYNVEFILDALDRHKLAHRVKVFRDGGEALDYLLAVGKYSDRYSFKQPSVILLDLRLPKVDGLDLLRLVRSNATTKMIHVVVFSSSNKRPGQDRELQAGSEQLHRKAHSIRPIC